MRQTLMGSRPWQPYERSYEFATGARLSIGERTLLMGILNITPDSFSDGGKYIDPEDAARRAAAMIQAGADILDIGGESTRPDSMPVSTQEELERVLPVLDRLRDLNNGVPISIDTYKAETARQALEHGVHIVNDIWGFRKDPNMASVAAQYGCPVILMHNREKPDYTDLVEEVKRDLETSVEIGLKAGVKADHIWLDPGIGFGKTYEHNLLLMRHLDQIVELGFPVLLGTSRKSLIRRTLQLPPDQVVEGTAATIALGIAQGCQIMRVHDVCEMRKAIQITDAVMA